jgi:outer membrane receptor protein involved in Fe transport
LSSVTEFYSNGDLRETASHFGTVGNLSYALDVDYLHVDGFYPNTDLDRVEWYSQVKLQLSPQDILFVQTKYQDFRSGDIVPYFDPTQIRQNFRFSEVQEPLLFLGYDHKWAEGVRTLFLGSRLINDLQYHDLAVPSIILVKLTNTVVDESTAPLYDVHYRNQFETYTAELAQLLETGPHSFILGGRFHSGDFATRNVLTNLETYYPSIAPFVYPPTGDQHTDMQRVSVYGYDIWRLTPQCFLTLGLGYDWLEYPANFRSVPVSTQQSHTEHLSPRAALHWTPVDPLTVRAIYSRSLGGVSFDESIRLEPTQLAGFNQSVRSFIPQSFVGSVSAAENEVIGTALEWRPGSDTKLQLQGERLRTVVDRSIGVFDFVADGGPVTVPSSTREKLDYEEWALALTFNQLIARDWSLGMTYRLTYSDLDRTYPAIPIDKYPYPRSEHALLHQPTLFVNYEHPSGFFGRTEYAWYIQQNSIGPEESLTQLNLFAGWRFARRRFEVSLGVLNVLGENYRLNPLNSYPNLPHERVFTARLGLNF